MAASRALPQCGTYFSRTLGTSRAAINNNGLLSSRVAAVPQRQFTSGTRLMEATSRNQATDEERARSIALLRLPKEATKSEIRAYLKSAGVDVKRTQMRLDRFTFHNDTVCFVELGNEQQAREAEKLASKKQLLNQKIFLKTPLKEGFFWAQGSKPDEGTTGSRYLLQEEGVPAAAIKPLLEGRRLMLSVQTPGWGGGAVSTRTELSREIIHKHMGKYGIEAIGGLSPFYGDKKPDPRLLCLLDFETKEGADSAIEALHDKEIEGRRVWLQISKAAPWRANQFGKVDKEVLALLQEKGVVGQEVYENQFHKKKMAAKKPKKV